MLCGLLAHFTITSEAPAINIQKDESHTSRSAIIHYAGTGENKRFVHVKLCETVDYTKFKC